MSSPPTRAAPQEIDARGLSCPLPILKAKRALNRLRSGELLRVVATDPGAVKDFESLVGQTGDRLLESTASDGEFGFLIEKA